MTTVKENTSIFDDITTQDNTGSKSTYSSESDNSRNEDDIEISANRDDSPTTTIIINKRNRPTSVITDDAIYEYIHCDYFVDPKTQERNVTQRNKNTNKWNKLNKKVSEELMDYLKDCMIAEAQKQKYR